MSWRFWRRSPRRFDSSISSNTAASSDIAGVSPDDPFIAVLDRTASRYSLLETIAACSVVAGVLAEDWDEFFKFYCQPSWAVGRIAGGGIVVALGIVLELWFGSRSAKAERKIRDRYALRVAELNVETERLRRDNLDTIALQRDRCLEGYGELVTALSRFSGMEFCLESIGGGSPADNEFRESRQFAFMILNAVRQAGWVEGHPIQQSTAIRPNVHLTFINPEGVDEEYNEVVETLADGINAGNAIAFTWYKWRPDRKIGSVIISVGHKPGTLEKYRLAHEQRTAQVKVREAK